AQHDVIHQTLPSEEWQRGRWGEVLQLGGASMVHRFYRIARPRFAVLAVNSRVSGQPVHAAVRDVALLLSSHAAEVSAARGDLDRAISTDRDEDGRGDGAREVTHAFAVEGTVTAARLRRGCCRAGRDLDDPACATETVLRRVAEARQPGPS